MDVYLTSRQVFTAMWFTISLLKGDKMGFLEKKKYIYIYIIMGTHAISENILLTTKQHKLFIILRKKVNSSKMMCMLYRDVKKKSVHVISATCPENLAQKR